MSKLLMSKLLWIVGLAVIAMPLGEAQAGSCEDRYAPRGAVSEQDYPKYMECKKREERGAAAREKYDQAKEKAGAAYQDMKTRVGDYLQGFSKKK